MADTTKNLIVEPVAITIIHFDIAEMRMRFRIIGLIYTKILLALLTVNLSTIPTGTKDLIISTSETTTKSSTHPLLTRDRQNKSLPFTM